MGDLTSALEAEAAAEIAAIRASAAAEADQLSAAAESSRGARLGDELERVRREAEADAARRVAGVARRLRAESLAERARMLERVGGAVAGRLPRLLADGAVAAALVDAVLSCAPERGAILRCAPALVERARTAAPNHTVTVDDSLADGLIATWADGRMTVTASLGGELERLWPRLQIAAARAADRREAP